MSFITVLSKIPWKKMLVEAPMIYEVAEKIWKKVSKTIGLTIPKKEGISLENLHERIARLEANEVQQAELVKNIAGQVGELSNALRIISKRLVLLTIVAAIAVIGVVILAFKIWS